MTDPRPTIAIVDCSTGITTEREMTDEEIADMEARNASQAEIRAREEAEKERVAEAKASALAKLQELGLTEDEAAAIIG